MSSSKKLFNDKKIKFFMLTRLREIIGQFYTFQRNDPTFYFLITSNGHLIVWLNIKRKICLINFF